MRKFPWYWSAKQHQRWAVMRARGRNHFVLATGVGSWGLTMFGIMALGPVFSGRIHPHLGYFLGMAALWGTAGFFFGISTWWLSERSFKRFDGE